MPSDATPIPLYLEDLQKMECDVPGCSHVQDSLHFVQMCHPLAGVRLLFDRAQGTMIAECQECEGYIVQVHVSKRPKENPFLKLQSLVGETKR